MSTKRKSDTSAASSKRARTNTDATVQALIDSILASKPAYSVPDDPEQIKDALVQLAQYARSLEEELVKGSSKTAPKTQEQLEEAAEKIARMARSGITKQMTWKPTCKEGRAKWAYDGLCSDPQVFGALLKLDGPMKTKTKKMPIAEFQDCLGRISASARYSSLSLRGTDVNIRYSPETGEFKLSGTYGV